MDSRKSAKILIVSGILCFVFAFALLAAFKGQFGKDTAGLSTEAEMEDTAELAPEPLGNSASDKDGGDGSGWIVYITGAVKKPGVYEVPCDSRIFAAVKAAGGFTADADKEAVNLAARLEDGVHIKIYRTGETREQPAAVKTSTPKSTAAETTSAPSNGKININTASQSELEKIKGVGPKTAEAIISYRSSKGGFARIEDIMQVKGIGAKKFEKMRESITVGE